MGRDVAEGDDFTRRVLVAVDAMGYGRSSDQRQLWMQRGMVRVLDDSAERTGLDRAAWERQTSGDGELSVLPLDQPEPRVVDDFVRHMAGALRRLNRHLPDERRLRLRLAIHHGVVTPGVAGCNGSGPVTVSRLCDSPLLRTAIVTSGADLAVILSGEVFRGVVLNEHTSLDPVDFREVRVEVKEFADDAYLLVPGHDVHTLDLGGGVAAPPPLPQWGATVQNVLYGPVDARGARFGADSGVNQGGRQP
jgi:hypothetical protein